MPQVLVRDSVLQTLKGWNYEKSKNINIASKSRASSFSVVGWLVGIFDQATVQIWHVVQNSPFTNPTYDDIEQVLSKDIGYYASALPGPHIQLLGPIYISHTTFKVGRASKDNISSVLEKAQSLLNLKTFALYNLEEESFYIKDTSSNLWVASDFSCLSESCVEREWYCFYAECKLPRVFSGTKKERHSIEPYCQRLWETFESRMQFSFLAGELKLLSQYQVVECEQLAKSSGFSPVVQSSVVDIRVLENYIQQICVLCRCCVDSKERAIQGVTVAYEKQDNCELEPCILQVCCLLQPHDRLELLIQSLRDQLYKQFKYLFIIQEEELQLAWKIWKPTGLVFPIMGLLPYPNENGIESHERMRRKHHEAFLLDYLFPYFRFSVSLFSWKEKQQMDNKHLLDVHRSISLKKKSVSCQNEIQSMVKGSYEYFHYMQDGIQDKGWGCAYRSLQTIISWFRLQGYTDRSIPNHREIQEMLVEMGDKETSFIASKQWIGATEVCYILQHYLGVESKILFVSSGAQMDNYARQIIQHFEHECTPVMIGGGVLAYTLLGIQYNESTGKVQYLILDPHYTGEDNVRVIIQKNWCGWKDSSIFQKDSFYNLCMPLRPKNVI